MRKNEPNDAIDSAADREEAALDLASRRQSFQAAMHDLDRELLNEEQVSPDRFDQVQEEIEEIDRELENLASKLTE